MLPTVLLLVGLACALVSRGLLFVAAFRVSAWWGLGLLVPFGPTFFRLSYPDEARTSRMFGLVTLPCLFAYLIMGPGPNYHQYLSKITGRGYGMEAKAKPTPASNTKTAPTLDERWVANYREFERLRAWNDALKLRKRDLLHSDTEGNRLYNEELARYNAALAKATAERDALTSAH